MCKSPPISRKESEEKVKNAIGQVKETFDNVFKDGNITVQAMLSPESDPGISIESWLYIQPSQVKVRTLKGHVIQPGWLLTSAVENYGDRDGNGTVDVVEHIESQCIEDCIDEAAVLITRWRLRMIHENTWCKAIADEHSLRRFNESKM